MHTFTTQLRVKYADTDKMGFAYYGNYPTYFEVARVECFRALGYSYKEMEDQGIGMPVLDMEIKYLKPAKYDDLLTVKVTIPEEPRARILFEYEIFNEEGTLLNKASTRLAFMNLESGRPVKMPEPLKRALSQYFN